MERPRSALISVIVVAGLLLVYLVYRPSFAGRLSLGASVATPPPLSAQPFHASFVSEEVCLQCHAQGKELPSLGLVAKKVPHEPRRNCVTCHLLPTRL
ncbi:MAG: hypothetical protein IH971_09055 [Candidatus Marinimicrobia bacterium]|nr:hypothetical protein [Candidatus Neomarinimicrobiota bacterium]